MEIRLTIRINSNNWPEVAHFFEGVAKSKRSEMARQLMRDGLEARQPKPKPERLVFHKHQDKIEPQYEPLEE